MLSLSLQQYPQWGDVRSTSLQYPRSFELGILLATQSAAVANDWLGTLPLKLPDRGARAYPMPGEDIEKDERKHPKAPFNYARDKRAVFDAAKAACLGAGNGGHNGAP